jgi:ABC-2 type transport system permease protein
MNRTLLKKCIGEARLLWLACAAGLFAFCWVRVWLVGRFEMSRFQAVIEQFREFERFSPVPFEHLFTYAGRIALTYDEPIVVLCLSLWAIARGSDSISGELGRGTMEMLLAQPISRLQLITTQAAVTVVGTALLAAVAWSGTCAGIATTTVKEEVTKTWTVPGFGWKIPIPLAPKETRIVPMSEKVEAEVFLPAAANLFSLGFFLAGLSTFLSSWDRYRWRTIGITVGIYVVQMILKIVGMAVDDYAWLLKCTFFTAYEPESFVRIALNSPRDTWSVILYEQGQWVELGPLGYDLVLILLGSVAYVLAAIVFCRRDLPAPL